MKDQIIKLIPKSIRRRVFGQWKKSFIIINNLMLTPVPKYELERKHFENAKLILDRKELLNLLPKNGIIAELGVDEGVFSEMILHISNPQKLHLVDFWGSERYNQVKREKVEKKFAQQIDQHQVEIDLGLSTQIVSKFKDDYFDWIYIDTDHSYKTTITELEAYRTKVKKKGIIAGHDFINGNWDGMVKYGVIEAVYEFCVKYNWEILFLTVENSDIPSFAIREIFTNNK